MTEKTLTQIGFYDRVDKLCSQLGFIANVIGLWDFSKQTLCEDDKWAIATIIDKQIEEIKKLSEELEKHS